MSRPFRTAIEIICRAASSGSHGSFRRKMRALTDAYHCGTQECVTLAPTVSAMIRYFFHLRRDETLIVDWEGEEFEDLAAATTEAVEAAKELVIASIRSGRPMDGDRLEIWSDEMGQVGEVRLLDVIILRRPL